MKPENLLIMVAMGWFMCWRAGELCIQIENEINANPLNADIPYIYYTAQTVQFLGIGTFVLGFISLWKKARRTIRNHDLAAMVESEIA